MHADTGETEKIRLDDYLTGVVTAEMPASFEPEALKAQAVAARSYTYNKYLENRASPGKIPGHNGADVCTDPGHCKAYMTLSDAREKWGARWEAAYYEKIRAAVTDTDGEVLTYDARPVNAVFHAASYGRTESSRDVWGGDLPYLKSVESPLSDAQSQITHVTLGAQEFKDAVCAAYPEASFPEEKAEWLKNVVRSEGGSVLTVQIGGVTLKGTDVRALFSLKSADFTVTASDDAVSFEVRGSGHGVGMSQYGANALAQSGYDYRAILARYYTGTEISHWE